jgi:hypothetical protein
MGLPAATYWKTYGKFSHGERGKKWLRSLKCSGKETSFGECKHNGGCPGVSGGTPVLFVDIQQV